MFIVDVDGKVAHVHRGYSEEMIDGFIQEMLALLPPEALAKPANGCRRRLHPRRRALGRDRSPREHGRSRDSGHASGRERVGPSCQTSEVAVTENQKQYKQAI